MVKNCNTCKKTVNANEKIYTRVAYNCSIWSGTALLPAAITGIKELGMKAKLLWNICVEENELGNFILCRSLAKIAEKIDSLDVEEKRKNMEKQLNGHTGMRKLGMLRKRRVTKLKKHMLLL